MTQKIDIRWDICTLCNLNCPACFMRKRNYEGLGAGYTHFEDFKKFIDTNGYMINSIEISSSGEPFLNPDTVKILKYAYENNIAITCGNGTNFNAMDDDKIHALVDYQVRQIAVAIDGASQETYSQYRRRGNFDTVISNLRKLVAYKKEKKSKFPIITWQYIIMHTDDSIEEIQKAINLSKELGIKIKFKLTWEKGYIPTDAEKIKELTGLNCVTREEFLDKKSKIYKLHCKQLWTLLCFNWNGDLLGCCSNKIPFAGLNANKMTLQEILDHPDLIKAKEYVQGHIPNDLSVSCMFCKDGLESVHLGGLDLNELNLPPERRS